MIGSQIKQTKLIVKIILIQILSRLKFKTYQEIGQILVIIRFLFILSKGKYIPEIFNSIINVILLAQHKESVVLTVGHKQNCCVKCILATNDDSLEKKISVFNIKYIFNNKLNSYNESEENDLKSMLLLEALKITDEVYDSYSTLPSFNEIITPLKEVLKQLSDYSFASDIKDCLNKLLIKFNKELPKVLLHESRPKPFMLPMFEPKFDDSHTNTATEKKKLMKKYKRELKGAQRELRKDSTFMRNTWINEIQENDAQRKRKVKELFGDLATQLNLYKKKKK
jgi:nucleolar protein 14